MRKRIENWMASDDCEVHGVGPLGSVVMRSRLTGRFIIKADRAPVRDGRYDVEETTWYTTFDKAAVDLPTFEAFGVVGNIARLAEVVIAPRFRRAPKPLIAPVEKIYSDL